MADATARALVHADAQRARLAWRLADRPVRDPSRQWARRRRRRSRLIVSRKGGAVLVDARCGLAFPACALAVDEAIRRAREHGVAFAGVTNSHHFGVAAYHLAPIADAGIDRARASATRRRAWRSPAAGGRCSEPIRSRRSFPRRDGAPLVIDLSLSEVARGKRDGRREGRPADPAGLGARPRRQSDDGSAGRARGIDAAHGRNQGCDAGTGRRVAGDGADRCRDGVRGELVFRRRRQSPAARPGISGVDPDALAGRDVYLERSKH